MEIFLGHRVRVCIAYAQYVRARVFYNLLDDPCTFSWVVCAEYTLCALCVRGANMQSLGVCSVHMQWICG